MKRSYIFLLGVVVVILFYSLVMAPASDRHAEIREEILMKESTLAKYEGFLARDPDTGEELKAAQGNFGAYAVTLIEAENDAIGFSKLSSYIQTLVAKAEVEVVSMKQLSERQQRYVVALPVQVNATANIKQLSELLRGIGAGPYLVSIDALEVNVINTNLPEKLRIRVDLSGYRTL